MKDYSDILKGNDRKALPEGLVWVTAGKGGDSVLVFGSEKTAMMDCGMAYCAKELIENTEKELAAHGRDRIDYVFLSHTHYDHVGALPYVIERWPEVTVCGSAKAQYVFGRPGALKVMKSMGEAAREKFGGPDQDREIRVDGLRIDRVLADGDTVSLGTETIVALETKGHTDCAMSYGIEPRKILFASESTGVIDEARGCVGAEILKSSDDAFAAADKCEAYGAELIICPHYGVVPKAFNRDYFESGREDARMKKAYIEELHRQGLDYDGILLEYKNRFYEGNVPIEAFMENAKNTVGVMLREIAE